MDPLSQGVIGASLPQSMSHKKTIVAATVFGALSGMAPDLDILIRSSTDPLMALEYHRQFTHSLFFIPFGGLICALVMYFVFARRWHINFKLTYLFCTLGFATHGLLDACTSYGTQLFWPFSNERFAWNTISIIDPLFTLPILTLVILSARQKTHAYARAALCWVILYQGLGAFQNHRVTLIGEELAHQRGHTPIRLVVKPGFGNLLLWKVIYETEDGYFTDAVRASPTPTVYPGEFIDKLNIERDLPWLDKDSQQAKDLARFQWFSDGFLSLDPKNPQRVVDMRYSMVPNEATGMWGIWLNKNAGTTDHVIMKQERDASARRMAKFKGMMWNEPWVLEGLKAP
jgi:inner membrane protein